MSFIYDLRGFSDEQRDFFNRAQKEGIDISYIYNPAFSVDQMIEICEGLQEGIDVTPFAKPEYSWEQMQVLCEAIKLGLDYKQLENPALSVEEMNKIKDTLLNKTSV